jgi:hypothetical protein
MMLTPHGVFNRPDATDTSGCRLIATNAEPSTRRAREFSRWALEKRLPACGKAVGAAMILPQAIPSAH